MKGLKLVLRVFKQLKISTYKENRLFHCVIDKDFADIKSSLHNYIPVINALDYNWKYKPHLRAKCAFRSTFYH